LSENLYFLTVYFPLDEEDDDDDFGVSVSLEVGFFFSSAGYISVETIRNTTSFALQLKCSMEQSRQQPLYFLLTRLLQRQANRDCSFATVGASCFGCSRSGKGGQRTNQVYGDYFVEAVKGSFAESTE
jgi:hypothetical protein